MFRKVTLALAAAASLGAMALSTNTASASPLFWPKHPHFHHHHWHPGFSVGYYGTGYYGGYQGCFVSRRVLTPYGFRWKTVNICY